MSERGRVGEMESGRALKGGGRAGEGGGKAEDKKRSLVQCCSADTV